MDTPTAHPFAKITPPRRAGWRTQSIHRCPFCGGIVRMAMTRDGAPVPQKSLLTDAGAGGWWGSPSGWSEALTPGGLVAISSDHAVATRGHYYGGRTCIYELWSSVRGAIPIIDQLVEAWAYPERPYWDKSTALRAGSTITDFDLDRFVAGGWGARATDERGGPPVLLVLVPPAASFRAREGRLPANLAEAAGLAAAVDYEPLRLALLAEIGATSEPRRS